MHKYLFRFKIAIKRLLRMQVSLTDRVYASIRQSDVIIDSGAHVGHHTVNLALYTNNKVHAFEPIPTLYAQLVENTKHLSNVVTHPFAVANVSGDLVIHVSSGESDGSSSLLVPKDHLKTNPDVVFSDELKVKAYTFDDWMDLYNVEKVDFLWLDMQGMELSVLRASAKLLRGVRVIYTEVSTIELYEGQGVYADLKAFLQQEGFHLVAESLPYGFTGDALFKRI